MGYGSGGQVVEVLIETMDNMSQMPQRMARRILVPVIMEQQSQDWDTEDEVLRAWADRPWVVDAFAERGVYLESDSRHPDHRP